ncbi:MAG: DUF2236 domain-containing protein [Nocardiopsaceae bacterium]|nr:DUF2236 domain-containing protein [Nocardiopsaceae bacterium]
MGVSDTGTPPPGGTANSPGGIPAATGLIERAAAEFAASIPSHPADDGYFGPGSVTWRLAADLSAPIAGLRSLLVQALHPLAMAGVEQHSAWRADPVGRYAATAGYLTVTTYGDRAAAERAAAVVRRIHEHVRGTDTVTGKPYAADDPDLLLWVHATTVDSTLRAASLFGSGGVGGSDGAGVTAQDADRYVAEMTAAAELIGMPSGLAPSSVAELDSYLARVRPELRATPAASDVAAYLLNPGLFPGSERSASRGTPPDPELRPGSDHSAFRGTPPDPRGLDEGVAELWDEIRDGVLGSLPDWAEDLYGFPHRELSEARREEIRQALGVFDALTIGEPGVLEARQRIELRIREARRP